MNLKEYTQNLFNAVCGKSQKLQAVNIAHKSYNKDDSAVFEAKDPYDRTKINYIRGKITDIYLNEDGAMIVGVEDMNGTSFEVLPHELHKDNSFALANIKVQDSFEPDYFQRRILWLHNQEDPQKNRELKTMEVN